MQRDRWIAVDPRQQVVGYAVAVQETLLRVQSLLGLEPDLDDIQRRHEDRDEQRARAGGSHLLANGQVVLFKRHLGKVSYNFLKLIFTLGFFRFVKMTGQV